MSKTALVTVLWEDASYSEYDHTGIIETILTGILVREDDDQIFIAMEIFADGKYRHVIAIPKSLIRKRRDTSVNWRMES